MNSLNLKNINFNYENKTILNNINIDFKENSLNIIMGKSGSGKSTLLKYLFKANFANQKKAFIYQENFLINNKSVLKNTLDGLLNDKRDKKSKLIKAFNILKELNIDHLLDVKVSKLSGGEKQRVQIARALIQDVSIIFADEPTSSLDAHTANELLKTIKKISLSKNITFIVSLHDLKLAKKYSDNSFYLNNQKIFIGIPDLEIFNKKDPNQVTDSDTKVKSKNMFSFCLFGLVTVLSFSYLFNKIEIPKENIFYNLFNFLSLLVPKSFEELLNLPFKTLFISLLETISIGIISSIFAFIISIPISLLAISNISASFISKTVRNCLNLIRTIPSIIWALLFVSAFGLGIFSGILALTVYSTGYLAKFFYESFENVNPNVIDCFKDLKATKLQIFKEAILPLSLPAIAGHFIFILEYNIRSASILGLVGAGGIGFYIKQYLDFRYFPAVSLALLMIFCVVYILDKFSQSLRKSILKDL